MLKFKLQLLQSTQRDGLNRFIFKMLTTEALLYSAEELERIDSLIEANMDAHLQSMIAERITLMMQEEMQEYQVNCSDFQAQTYEESICLIVNKLSENWARKEEKYLALISQSQQQRQRISLLNTEKDAKIGQHIEQLSKLSTRLVEEIREKNQLISKNFTLREQISTTKATLAMQNEEKSMHLERQNGIISQLTAQLQETKGHCQQISIEKASLRESKLQLEQQLSDLLEELTEDIERHKLNLITSNIIAQQLQETQEDKLRQIAKYAKIHEENKRVVDILGKVMRYFEVHLEDLKAEEFEEPLPIYHQFDHLMSERNDITLHLSTFTESLQQFSRIFYQNKSQLAANLQKNTSLERELAQLQQLYETQVKNKIALEAQLANQKHEHYCALLDVDRSKRKIEDSLLQNLQSVKRMQEKLQALQEQIKDKDSKTKQLSQQLTKVTSENESLKQVLKAEQQSNYELKEEILNMKSNLDMMMKTEEDDQDCSFNIVQQLIDKNNELTSQITTKKLQIDLNQEKMAYQESIIEKQTTQIDNLTEEISDLKQIVKTKEEQIKKQEKQYNVLTQRYTILENYMKEEKEIKKMQQMKVYCDQENQTDPMKDTVQSRIRRQIIRQNVRSQVQKSHSLLSDKQQNKENILDHNTANRSLLTARQKQAYKEKIMTLNEIINYMLNYCKGYGQGEIRKGSWFISQIAKYGNQYEERLLDQTHLAPKLKNMKFIEAICRQDQNCSKLIREYETVIEFYLGRCTKMSNSSVSVSPITQEKLNKTVNKSRHHQANQYIF